MICLNNAANGDPTIFLDSKITGYYVVLITLKETFLQIPTCNKCDKIVRKENYINKTDSAWIMAGITFGLIGLMCLLIEIPSVLQGDYSSLFQTPVVGLILLIPSMFAIWRSFKARKNIQDFLHILGYEEI